MKGKGTGHCHPLAKCNNNISPPNPFLKRKEVNKDKNLFKICR